LANLRRLGWQDAGGGEQEGLPSVKMEQGACKEISKGDD
jgi:hypothetical protein